jgi:O-antigen/teichoic acid export membrane protein
MVGHLASIGSAGIYSIGQRVAYSVFTFMTAIENVFSPQVYKQMFEIHDEGGETIGRYVTPFAYVSIFVALFIALISEEAIFVLTPVSYHGAIDIVAVLSIYYGFLFFGKLSGNQLIFMKKTYITSILTMVRICLNVGINIPFILRWGAIGAAWATLLAGLISGYISFVVSQHYYQIKWEYKKLGLIFLSFTTFTMCVILLRYFDVVYTIRLMVKCTSIAIFIFIGVQIKVITVENYNIVKNILASKGNILYQRN